MVIKTYIGNISKPDQITALQALSFRKTYRVVILPVGFELWRFVSMKRYLKFSDFWIDPPTMKFIMETFHNMGNFTQTYKKEVIRNDLAILQAWKNSYSNWRLKIRINREVIAYFGETGPQRALEEHLNIFNFSGDDKISKVIETRLGGLNQYVVPRFKGLPDQNEWAVIEHWSHI